MSRLRVDNLTAQTPLTHSEATELVGAGGGFNIVISGRRGTFGYSNFGNRNQLFYQPNRFGGGWNRGGWGHQGFQQPRFGRGGFGHGRFNQFSPGFNRGFGSGHFHRH